MAKETSSSYEYLIAFGSNLGERKLYVEQAIRYIEAEIGEIIAISNIIESEPIGAADLKFLNGVLRLNSVLEPRVLLARLLEIETRLGRTRQVKWGNRTIDLDIILVRFDDDPIIINEPELTIPHPQALKRAFVLNPCQEIAGEWMFPGKNLPLALLNLEEET